MIEKILERLEALKEDAYDKWDGGASYSAYINAIKIVQEVAKDGGWIPVETELPKISNSYLVTKMCENDGNPIYETAHEIFWTTEGKWDCERDEYCDWKVIAWQNKVAPYQKGE